MNDLNIFLLVTNWGGIEQLSCVKVTWKDIFVTDI